jgi:hypothetical protein
MTDTQEWIPCSQPQVGDTLKWSEPLWAPPNKPRGKRDKIGEQEIIAELITIKDVLEFKVINVKKISGNDAEVQVQADDNIRRKQSSIDLGSCHKLLSK